MERWKQGIEQRRFWLTGCTSRLPKGPLTRWLLSCAASACNLTKFHPSLKLDPTSASYTATNTQANLVKMFCLLALDMHVIQLKRHRQDTSQIAPEIQTIWDDGGCT